MSYSNYPPGVTGHEDVFGPISEDVFEDDRECPECGYSGPCMVSRDRYDTACIENWCCGECGQDFEADITDDLYEEHLDRMAEEREDDWRYEL